MNNQPDSIPSSPIEKLIDLFSEESGLPWPKQWNGNKPEKWLDPLVAINKAANGDLYIREQAIKESIAQYRNDGIVISSPASILPKALQLIHIWAGGRKNDPTEAEFVAYRNRVMALGYNAMW